MRKVIFATAIFGTTLTISSYEASAQFYISASGGLEQSRPYERNFVVQTSPKPQAAPAPGQPIPPPNPPGVDVIDSVIHLTPGFAGNAAIGYNFSNYNMRLELEAGYQRSLYDSVDQFLPNDPVRSPGGGAANFAVQGARRIYTGAVNLFYDVPTGIFVWPYVGLGVGAASEQLTPLNILVPDGGGVPPGGRVSTDSFITFGHSNFVTNFLFQAEIGLSVEVAKGLVISPSFRYQFINDDDASRYGNTQNYVVRLGTRYTF
jgi:opacity protein-like surface antigen